MDEVVKKVAAVGLPIIILVVTMATTGFTGVAAITAALAFLCGPAGMLGGIAVLGFTALITDPLAKVITSVGDYSIESGSSIPSA
ncbi:hypothetical protein [Nostoc parmelioides]|uniref:hypothetical protein n=1 Tax=Nostoc parmelioides TaxID=1521621 RepID=UPI001F54F693|nr:hypothetical protein [Nostoc parmelioides]